MEGEEVHKAKDTEMHICRRHTLDVEETEVNLCRRPSLLDIPSTNRRRHGHSRNNSRPSSRASFSLDMNGLDISILHWDDAEVDSWLDEIGMNEHKSLFKQQAITSGRRLLSLTEEHLKEIGVVVGDRIELMFHIDELRKTAGWVSRATFVDIPTLLNQLDIEKTQRTLRLYPKRIILIRHAESEGNVDTSVYAKIPDNKLKLTSKGVSQAIKAGEELKELVGNEMVTFYVSPYLRSRLTYKYIRQAFLDQQVMFYREDPRLREQEWGNFQNNVRGGTLSYIIHEALVTTWNASQVPKVMEERRQIGAFYYRFATGESGSDVFDRVSTFLETLYRDMEKGGCGDNAILVSHGLFCRLFLTRFYHWSVEKFHKLWNFDNCQFGIMELQKDGYYKLITKLQSDD